MGETVDSQIPAPNVTPAPRIVVSRMGRPVYCVETMAMAVASKFTKAIGTRMRQPRLVDGSDRYREK